MSGIMPSSASSNNDSANHLEEWKQARDLLKSFDDHLHDLRKYGFSFLTALLAAESILIPSKNMPAQVKFAVFAVTILLIAALHLFDKNYRVFQQAANTRALVLERKLNLELSEVISVRHGKNRIDLIVEIVYILFIAGVALLGGFVLWREWNWVAGLLVFAIVIAFVPRFTLALRFARKDEEDWTISPIECTKGGIIRITLNNLTTKKPQFIKENPMPVPIVFQKDALIWEIRSEDGLKVYPKTAAKEIKVYDSYTWLWDTSKVEKGVYQLHIRDWPIPLFTIIVFDNTSQPVGLKS